jgi:uncharacterized protein (DUF1778 family)
MTCWRVSGCSAWTTRAGVEFLAVLDRPVADKPRLVELFAEDSIFE